MDKKKEDATQGTMVEWKSEERTANVVEKRRICLRRAKSAQVTKTEDTFTAIRARGGGAPEGAPPRPRELAVKESEAMCRVQNTKKIVCEIKVPAPNPMFNNVPRRMFQTKKNKSPNETKKI